MSAPRAGGIEGGGDAGIGGGAGATAAPIRVLFAGTTFVLGGAERILAHLARGIDRPPFEVEVLALRDPGPIGEELRAAGLKVTSGMTHAGRLDPTLVPRLHAFLRRGRFEAIYFLDHAHAVFYTTLASCGTSVRVRLMPVHTTGQWDGRPSLRRPIRLVLSRLDRIIAIAEAQRRYLIEEEGVPESKLVVIPNGIPLEAPDAETRRCRRARVRASLGIGEGVPVVGITAVLRPEKNHELLLAAFARVRDSVPDAELWVVGDGPRRSFVEEEAARLGLLVAQVEGTPKRVAGAPAVRFFGSRADARDLMSALDLAVLASHPRVETLPLSLLEAMDARVPAVATRVGALHEMIEDGASGILVPPGDAEALASAITRLLRDPALRSAMGSRAGQIAQDRFSVERMVSATARLLQDLLRG